MTFASHPHTKHTLFHFLPAYEILFSLALPMPLSSVPLQVPDPEPLFDQPIAELKRHDWNTMLASCSPNALAQWLSACWRISGYELSADTVCERLTKNGSVSFRGLSDATEGAFSRWQSSLMRVLRRWAEVFVWWILCSRRWGWSPAETSQREYFARAWQVSHSKANSSTLSCATQ